MVGEECQEIEREADLPTFMLCEWKDRAKLGPQRKGGVRSIPMVCSEDYTCAAALPRT